MFGLANVDTFIIRVGFWLANIDTIRILTLYEHYPLTRIVTLTITYQKQHRLIVLNTGRNKSEPAFFGAQVLGRLSG